VGDCGWCISKSEGEMLFPEHKFFGSLFQRDSFHSRSIKTSKVYVKQVYLESRFLEVSSAAFKTCARISYIWAIFNSFFFFFAVLGFELRAYTLSHSTSPLL
jgi:hypothetical protein